MPSLTEPTAPVEGFPFRYRWDPELVKVFDQQVQTIREDIARAHDDDKLVIYLSCPISSRGGGHSGTNVEVAKFTQRSLLRRWGHRLWVLNPAVYQMESKSGYGLLEVYARQNGIDLKEHKPGGGDYMRMWIKVLVEEALPLNRQTGSTAPDERLGRRFDGYYFLGPSDVHAFFTQERNDVPLTDALEEYFARKHATDPEFLDAYSVPGIDWGASAKDAGTAAEQQQRRDLWESRRKDFIRFYALRASVNYSLGSHDEWNIFAELNRRRAAVVDKNGFPDVGSLLAGWFDGRQIDPGAAVVPLVPGYAT